MYYHHLSKLLLIFSIFVCSFKILNKVDLSADCDAAFLSCDLNFMLFES